MVDQDKNNGDGVSNESDIPSSRFRKLSGVYRFLFCWFHSYRDFACGPPNPGTAGGKYGGTA